MNISRIDTLKQEINELRRRLDFANAEVNGIGKRRTNAKRAVSMLEQHAANREKIEEAKRELQNYQQEYNTVSRNYCSILDEIRRKNVELTQEERVITNLQRSFHL